MGRSSDLLFALALIAAKWKKPSGPYPSIAATGVLDAESAALCPDGAAAVQAVKHTAEKVAAAVRALAREPAAVIFYPAADERSVADWRATAEIPPHVQLRPVASLEEALATLGITLEKVYLGNPFRGLEHFDYAHRAIFFGRDREILEVIGQLLRRESSGAPGLLVEGASGSGKSSFLRAGVLAALINPAAQPEDVQEVLGRRPIHDTASKAIWRIGLLPTGANEASIVRSVQGCWKALPELSAHMDERIDSLFDLARHLSAHWPPGQRFVWLLDQFEEIFLAGLDGSKIDAIGRFLLALQAQGVWTLACVRSDALAELKRYPALRQVFGTNEGQYYLETMSATALDDVISRPARVAGVTFGQAPSGKRLDQALREDAYDDRENALPLLQFTLHELYQRRSGTMLTVDAYERLGGLSGSVASTAAARLQTVPNDLRGAMPRLFRNLVSVDETGRPSRRYALMKEISGDAAQKQLLAGLVECRLCVTDQLDGQPVATLAHDSLLRTWPTLVEWLAQEAGLLQSREIAQREARLWMDNGETDSWLAGAEKLAAFRTLETSGITLTPPARAFIECSHRRMRRTARLRQAAVGIIALLAVVASTAGWVATRKEREAQRQTAEALSAQSRLLVAAAVQRLKEHDVAGAQRIILDVLTNPRFKGDRTPEAISAFQEVRAADFQLAALLGHDAAVVAAVYSPDGTRIVTASNDRTARVWDARTGNELAILSGHIGDVTAAAFSPDGTRIVTASLDKTARIWDARTGVQLAALSGYDRSYSSVAYSPDGSRIVTASGDKTAQVWDARTGVQLAVMSGHEGAIYSAVFSPDGTHILTASRDKTARIWDVRSGAQIIVLRGHDDSVDTAAYSPDGARVVTASHDKTARIWDVRTGAELASLLGHDATIYSAVYSPDGNHIVTASYDKTARIWDVHTGRQVEVFSGHGGTIYSATYSPDGSRVVTASLDKTARIWDAHGPGSMILTGHESSVDSVDYSRMDSASSRHPLTRPLEYGTRRAGNRSRCSRVMRAMFTERCIRSTALVSSRPRTIRPREFGMGGRGFRSHFSRAMEGMSIPRPSRQMGAAFSPPRTTRPHEYGTREPASRWWSFRAITATS